MLKNILKLQSNTQSVLKRLKSAKTLLFEARTSFGKNNVSEMNEEILLAHVLNDNSLEHLRQNAENITLTADQIKQFKDLCEARKCRMPVQYIIKNWDFRGLNLKMVPPVFIPRPETEKLVELIVNKTKMQTNSLKFLEIGCGSGAISLAILKELPDSLCLAIDQSKMACDLTIENAKLHKLQGRLKLLHHKLTDGTLPNMIAENCFDLIVSNPPYVKTMDLTKLEDEIKIYEDLRALDGGKDGLKIIKLILDLSAKYLKEGGSLWLETDSSQHKIIEELVHSLKDLNLSFVGSFKDIFQNDRFVEIVKKSNS